MELDLLKAIQTIHHPFLDTFFELVTILGEEFILVPLLAVIYWTLNKKFGEKLGYILLTSLMLNSILKELFNFKRPIGEEGIRTLRPETATGKSFPSGHTQGSTTVAATLSLKLKKRWVTILSSILVVLIGFSRLYLGVHYPKDVVVGILLGVLVAYLGMKALEKIDPLKVYWVTLLIFLPMLFFGQSENFVKSVAGYLGFVLGITLEKKFVKFTMDVTSTRKVLRVFIGLIFVVLIRSGLKALFPELLVFDFIRYAFLTFFTLGVYPWIFTKLKV